MALSKRWKLALISRSNSSHCRARNKTRNGNAALQTIVFAGTKRTGVRGVTHLAPNVFLRSAGQSASIRLKQDRAAARGPCGVQI